MSKPSAPTSFSDPSQSTLGLVIPESEHANSGKLKSGEVTVKCITHDGVDGVPICSAVALVTEAETKFKLGEEALFSADSMTKTITAAALLRMTEETKYLAVFPNGVETKLAELLPLLREKFPQSEYIKTELELHHDFDKITLRDLAQHTSGLAGTDREALNQKLAGGTKLSVEAILDTEKSAKSGKHGEYSYSNLGYELLGAALIAIHSQANGKAENSQYSQVVNELVIDPVRARVTEKIGAATAENLRFFTSDQMEIVGGKTTVVGYPELEIKFGKAYRDQKFGETASHLYDIACGGSYTNPDSMARIALHVLSDKAELSIFKPTTLALLNSSTTPIPKELGKPTDRCGFGYESFSEHPEYRIHGGLGYGSNSNAAVNIQTNTSAVAMVSFEQDLTLPLAYAALHGKKLETKISLTPELFDKSIELHKNFSEEQLVEMRKGLEKSYEEFREKFEAAQKRTTEAPAKEIELAAQYRPIIARDCFDKFFDATKDLDPKELKLKNDLKAWLHKALNYQTTNPEALTLAASLDEIKTREDLGKVFAHVDLDHLRLIDSKHLGGKNNITPNLKLEFAGAELVSSTQENLRSYVDGTGFSGSLALSQHGTTHTANSQNIGSNTTFPIHSVGKLFTGILVMEAVRQGILEEGQLSQTVKLENSTLEKLPENIREHLGKTTLHQLMTHQSGLQDYLPNYQKAVASALQSGTEIPRVTRAEDILSFAESTILALPYTNEKGKRVESDYSNLGIALVGLAIQEAYNSKHRSSGLTYDQILERCILAPAGIVNFSSKRLENSTTNPRDPVAPHICGSPGGGYWTDAESLSKFGNWVCERWQDPEFQRLTKTYGTEFYDSKSGKLSHGGYTESSNAYLTIFPERGLAYAGLSNQPVNTFAIAENVESQVVSYYKNLEATQKASSSSTQERPASSPKQTSGKKLEDKDNSITLG